MRCVKFLFYPLCGFIVLLLPLSAHSQSDQPIYSGTSKSLAGAWQNWSSAKVDFGATSYVYSGDTYSAQITYTSGRQGFNIENPGINTVLYTNLTFLINGGSAGSQRIAVYGLANNTAGPSVSLNNYISGGSVAAGEWRQVTIPLADLGIADTANVDGLVLAEPTGSAQPSFYVDNILLTAAPPPSSVTLAVNAGSIVRTVDSRIFGVNAGAWDNEFNTAGTRSLLSAANIQVMRFPGGSLSDTYNWQTGTTVGDSTPMTGTFDDFGGAVTAFKVQAFVTTNYGSGTAQEAADWVSYSNLTKGYGIKYWEIGNEVYGSWEYDTHAVRNDPYTYAVQVKEYIAAMKAVDPTIKIGVVAITGEDSYANNTDHPATNPVTKVVHYGWTPVVLATLKSLGVTPDFLIYHRYEQYAGFENDENLLLAAQTWPNDAANLRMMLNDYLGGAAANVEIVCTENNSVYANPGKQTTSLVNGLYLADSIGNLLQTEFNAMVWWDLRNGQLQNYNNSPSLYGWRKYGDYGLVIGDAGYPTYYALKLMQYLGAGGDAVVSTSSSYPLLSSYSVLHKNGSLSVLVINKSASNAMTADIHISSFLPSGVATVYSYGIPQDDAAETGAGSTDIAQTALNDVSESFSYKFPPYSMTIISITPSTKVVPLSLKFNPANVITGGSSTVTVTINGIAPKGGLAVSLGGTDGPSVSIPHSVTVSAGKSTATFTATAGAGANYGTATVTASANGSSVSGTLTVNKPTPTAVTLSPNSVIGGSSLTGTVTISGPAPTGGLKISLAATGSAAVPTSVTIAAGAKTAAFTVTTSAITTTSKSTISAACSGVTKSSTLTINAVVLLSLAFNPATVAPSQTSSLTVTLSGPAPTGGAVVTLTSGNSNEVWLSSNTVKIPAGSNSATVTANTSTIVGNVSITVTGRYNGTSKGAVLKLQW